MGCLNCWDFLSSQKCGNLAFFCTILTDWYKSSLQSGRLFFNRDQATPTYVAITLRAHSLSSRAQSVHGWPIILCVLSKRSRRSVVSGLLYSNNSGKMLKHLLIQRRRYIIGASEARPYLVMNVAILSVCTYVCICHGPDICFCDS